MKMTMVKYFKIIDEALQLVGQTHGSDGFDLNSRNDFGNALMLVLRPLGMEGIAGWLAYYVLLYQHLFDLTASMWVDDEDTQESYLNTMVLCDWVFGDRKKFPQPSEGFSWLLMDVFLGYGWSGIELFDDNQLAETITVIDYRFLGEEWMRYRGKVSLAYHLNQELENETGCCATDVSLAEFEEMGIPCRQFVLSDVVDEENFKAFRQSLGMIVSKLLDQDSLDYEALMDDPNYLAAFN